jgi:hypothetical protein
MNGARPNHNDQAIVGARQYSLKIATSVMDEGCTGGRKRKLLNENCRRKKGPNSLDPKIAGFRSPWFFRDGYGSHEVESG